jgi:hypothetical protein
MSDPVPVDALYWRDFNRTAEDDVDKLADDDFKKTHLSPTDEFANLLLQPGIPSTFITLDATVSYFYTNAKYQIKVFGVADGSE